MLNKIREFILSAAITITDSIPGIVFGILILLASTALVVVLSKQRISDNPIVMVLSSEPIVSGGTGFVVRNSKGTSYIVTAQHVCDPRDSTGERFVIKHEGVNYNASVVTADEYTDICVLTRPFNLSVKPVTVSDLSYQFQSVKVVGYPKLLVKTSFDAMLTNINESMDLTVEADPITGNCPDGKPFLIRPPYDIIECVERHAAGLKINRPLLEGVSGAPVLSLQNEVVGVISTTDGRNSYAAKSEHLKRILDSLP